MIDAAGLPPRAADRAKRIFQRLGEAEAKVHRVDIEHVHFHEVGAVDSIVDVVGACVALELLGVEEFSCSELPTGSGTVRTAHGLLPCPPRHSGTPQGRPHRGNRAGRRSPHAHGGRHPHHADHRLRPPPAMAVSAVGYGAGTRENEGVPNLLRVFLGEPGPAGALDAAVELSCNLDDCSGQVLGAAMEELFLAGCLDAWAAPIFMKKSRPAYLLSVLCEPGDATGWSRSSSARRPRWASAATTVDGPNSFAGSSRWRRPTARSASRSASGRDGPVGHPGI